jgi:hypothetical protein
MFEVISELPEGTIGFNATGQVTSDDYKNTLIPMVENALREHPRIKMLGVFGDQFEGYSVDAAWEDTKLGISTWRGFDRVAVVSDKNWIAAMVKAAGFIIPCPVQVFALSDVNDAKRWLEESFGAMHIDQDGHIVTAKLIGKLDAEVYEKKNIELENAFAATDSMRLILDLRQFDGWCSLSAIADHLSLIRSHRKNMSHVAIVGNKAWEHALATHVAPHFVSGQVNYFKEDEYAGAENWIKG